MSAGDAVTPSVAPPVAPSDLGLAAAVCRRALDPLVDRDWTVRAGDLDWDVRSTLTHVCDAVGWYAAHLAVQGRHRLRLDFRVHDDATNAEVLDVLDAAAATLAQVARAAPPDVRAYHSAGMADASGFVAMGCDEVLVHGWDACRGLGLGLVVAPDLAAGVLRRLFPWAPTDVAPWPALLWANGRLDLPGRRPRLGPDWVWHCAPLGRMGRHDPDVERFVARTLRLGCGGRRLAGGVGAMSAAAMSSLPAGPRRVDVAAAYDLGVDTYASLWSPVIRPPARSVVAALGLQGAPRVLDIGAGPGALVSSILDAAPAARVVALDASIEMLRAARRHTSASAIKGDALALPIGDATVDAVLCAFVLFHLTDPSCAVAQVARVLRTGGRVGTVTWVREATLKASAVWDETFAEAGVPPLPPRRVDTGLDSPEAMGALFTAGGLQPHRIWLERLTHRWEPSTYWRLVTGTGANRARLQLVDEESRAALLATARTQLEALDPEDFAWWGEVICAVASKPG